MSSQPASTPAREPSLLSVGEYLALGETEHGYDELVEGRVVMSPGPAPDHNHAAVEVLIQLRGQLPAELEVLLDLDVNLELAPPDAPGFTRRPDLIVVRRSARERVRQEGGIIRAAEVVVVAEFLSPGSRRTDNVMKRLDYADAGIPHYWIVDLDEPVSLIACHLAGELGYVDGGSATGVFATTEPFPIRLDLDALG
jgi:Uma2 family endonuclease